jgi:hypothetical protein
MWYDILLIISLLTSTFKLNNDTWIPILSITSLPVC